MGTAKRYCATDIGSNAIKTRLIEYTAGTIRTLSEARYPVRLGTGSFDRGEISREDIEATIGAFEEIGGLCREFNVHRIRAVATSAVREAVNRDELVNDVLRRTRVHVEVITGAEEARLLARGVQPDLKTGAHNLIIDIGGGSTEVIYTQKDLRIATVHSLRLGAVRLQQMIGSDGKISGKQWALLEESVNSVLEQSRLPEIARDTYVVGVAGTIGALLDIRAVRDGRHHRSFTAGDLEAMIKSLREMTVDRMKQAYGVDLRRGQVIVPGAVILAGLMELYSIDRIRVSDRGLRDGLLQDLIDSNESAAS